MSESYYLLEMPPSERPQLWIDSGSHEIVAMSESEIRFKRLDADADRTFDVIEGLVCFNDGSVDNVKGYIISSSNDILVFNTVVGEGLTFKRMMKEQLAILAKYGKPKEEDDNDGQGLPDPKGWTPRPRNHRR